VVVETVVLIVVVSVSVEVEVTVKVNVAQALVVTQSALWSNGESAEYFDTVFVTVLVVIDVTVFVVERVAVPEQAVVVVAGTPLTFREITANDP
jgi:hypothetical protein